MLGDDISLLSMQFPALELGRYLLAHDLIDALFQAVVGEILAKYGKLVTIF